MYQQTGLARNVRLSKDYAHTNSRNYNKKGHRCMLCCRALKEKKGISTTKGRERCCVPLCSATYYEFIDPSESCEHRWHNFCDLTSLKPAGKTPKKGEKEQSQNRYRELLKD